MLITALEKEKRELVEKGKLEDKIETAQKMISKGFEAALIAEITGLSEPKILQLRQEMQSHYHEA